MKKLLIVFITLVLAIKGIAQTIETSVSGSTVDTKNVPVETAIFIIEESLDFINEMVADSTGIFFVSTVLPETVVSIV